MANDRTNSDERTEPATPRRREEARREGRVARSSELSAAAVLLAGAATLATVGGASLAGFAFRTMRDSAHTLSLGDMNAATAVHSLRTLLMELGVALLPFAAAVLATGLLVNLVQTGGVIAFERLQPKFSNLDPFAGVKRILSADSAFTALKSVVKLAALGWLTYSLVRHEWPELASLTHSSPVTTAAVVRTLLLKLAMVVGLAFLAVAAVDYAFQRFQLERQLKMSKQDVAREFRETEGDPLVKARILSIARARARQRMLQAVPSADVVVVNPVHIAVALRYDMDVAPAPVVVAMGERKLAERIKALALESGVPVIENIP
ncbi:MAG: EscU/YscU/HrcU family type III secretion system export apparatus switch protein, partial [Gaiellaceae bacterium]